MLPEDSRSVQDGLEEVPVGIRDQQDYHGTDEKERGFEQGEQRVRDTREKRVVQSWHSMTNITHVAHSKHLMGEINYRIRFL